MLKKGAALVVFALFSAGGARAAEPSGQRQSLRDRIGVSSAERALREGPAAERERAITRLGAIATPRSLELLVKALEGNGPAQSPRERLLAVRGLSAHADSARVRDCLMRVMTGISATAERADPLLELLRDTAAQALARSNDPASMAVLARALRQPGTVAKAARSALVANPPPNIAALVRAHGAPTIELVRVLGELGDQRATWPLREIVERGSRELRAEAAVALARLGSLEPVGLARKWREESTDPLLLLAGLEISTLAHDTSAAPLLVSLLGRAETRERALALAGQWDDTEVDRALSQQASRAELSELPALLAALGHAPKHDGAAVLERLARAPASSPLAFSILLRAPGDPARSALQRLLADPALKRAAARAATLRQLVLGDSLSGLLATLDSLVHSKSSADRSVGAFGLASLDQDAARELVWSSDPVVAEAAARAAPFVGAGVAAADRLVRERPGRLRFQLALSLIDRRARSRVPTKLLLELFDEGSVASPLAAFALAERDSTDLRGRLIEQLASPDALLRAQVALGFGASEEPDALGVLEAAYRFELDPKVRHALVQALARRPHEVRKRTLALAAALDPDPATRTLARLSLRGSRAAETVQGTGTVLAVLDRTDGAGRGAVVTVPGGLALPVLADPDGIIALGGLPAGPVALRVALLPVADKSRPQGSP